MLSCNPTVAHFPAVISDRTTLVSFPRSSNLRASSSYSPQPHALRCCKEKPALVLRRQGRPAATGPTCLFGGKGKEGKDEDEVSPWKSLGKAMENLKKDTSIEGLLREQMQKQEFDGGGGSGKFRTGGGDGSGESEEEDEILDEFIQVILATGGLIFLYIYIIHGAELFRLVKDFIVYLFGGAVSNRLRRAMFVSSRFLRSLTKRKQVPTQEQIELGLIVSLIQTPTWWNKPEKIARVARKLARAKASLQDKYAAYAS